MGEITFRFEDESLETKVLPSEQGMTILEIAEDNDIHLNHNCGEVCACSTCHIYVDKGDDLLKEISDREEDFIDRAINPRIESRLGCQCEILNEEGDLEVTIPDQRKIIGHEH
ncbi:MAG: 2Fe-2S iron-sulfur cluster-binding protein [Saprospiraceae bacterium]|nr:2Fe-2S iron-sulfur cluster-binding protein [Saprospiraceae bacterium]